MISILNIILPIFIFLFGLALGSFLNCVIYRLYHNKSPLAGRSFCPCCKHQLAWFDLIPVFSFIFLSGRCRYCAKKISWQYPAVELATAILVIIIYSKLNFQFSLSNFQPLISFLSLTVFTCFLIVIFVYDFKYSVIPDKISIPGFIIVFMLQIINFLFSQQNKNIYQFLLSLFLAGLLGGLFFLIQFAVSRGRWVGGGDIRLGVLMGLMLAWPNILVGLFLAYIIGSFITLPLVALGRKKLKSEIPFGTFLTLGAYIALLWGDEIIRWYLKISLL